MRRILKKNPLLSLYNNYLYDSLLPMNISYWYNYGSLLGLCLIIQIVSGIFLAMYYIPQIDLAFNSIEYIMREVPYGWLIRYIHANGASFFFFIVYLHIARSLLYGSYIGKKTLTWNIGIILFLLMIITAFIGYTLVWGQMSLWGATVITNLLSTVPFIGKELVEYIWGGFNVGGPTLNRFYSIHYLLPFIITAFTIAHLIALHDVGGSNPLGFRSNIKLINFHPYFSLKDYLGFILLIFLLLLIVFYNPNKLGHSDNYIPGNNLITPSHIVPESYLLPFYAILRSITHKRLGVIAMLASILILLIIPYLHYHIINSSKFRPMYKKGLYLFFICFLLLFYIGQAEVEAPYILIGQILTLFYFSFFILFIPIISFLEYFLYHYNYNYLYTISLEKKKI
jgi:ubiquinol-cytochrome c reductase cytochrome b subunit